MRLRFDIAAIGLLFACSTEPVTSDSQPAALGGSCGDSVTCADGSHCAKDVGTCEAAVEGTCVAVPDACIEIWDPVCGCDGVTYSNECHARQAGKNVASLGECEVACAEGQYYAREPGVCHGEGQCAAKPEVCYDIWAPVCGCDGVTYANDCDAAAAGANIASEGVCDTVGVACGGFLGLGCGDDAWCDFDEPACGIGDHLGVCKARPQACIEIWDPVCGCDGNTYSTSCHANAAGQGVFYEGECT